MKIINQQFRKLLNKNSDMYSDLPTQNTTHNIQRANPVPLVRNYPLRNRRNFGLGAAGDT